MIELKIIADSNIKAIEMIETLFPVVKVLELRVDSEYKFTNEKVYTIRVQHADKKT